MTRTVVLALSIGLLLGVGVSPSRASSAPEQSKPEEVPELLRGCNPGAEPPDLGVPLPPKTQPKPAPATPNPEEMPT